jgi:hypothetical protein
MTVFMTGTNNWCTNEVEMELRVVHCIEELYPLSQQIAATTDRTVFTKALHIV